MRPQEAITTALKAQGWLKRRLNPVRFQEVVQRRKELEVRQSPGPAKISVLWRCKVEHRQRNAVVYLKPAGKEICPGEAGWQSLLKVPGQSLNRVAGQILPAATSDAAAPH